MQLLDGLEVIRREKRLNVARAILYMAQGESLSSSIHLERQKIRTHCPVRFSVSCSRRHQKNSVSSALALCASAPPPSPPFRQFSVIPGQSNKRAPWRHFRIFNFHQQPRWRQLSCHTFCCYNFFFGLSNSIQRQFGRLPVDNQILIKRVPDSRLPDD